MYSYGNFTALGLNPDSLAFMRWKVFFNIHTFNQRGGNSPML